jgi:hypothetical protein
VNAYSPDVDVAGVIALCNDSVDHDPAVDVGNANADSVCVNVDLDESVQEVPVPLQLQQPQCSATIIATVDCYRAESNPTDCFEGTYGIGSTNGWCFVALVLFDIFVSSIIYRFMMKGKQERYSIDVAHKRGRNRAHEARAQRNCRRRVKARRTNKTPWTAICMYIFCILFTANIVSPCIGPCIGIDEGITEAVCHIFFASFSRGMTRTQDHRDHELSRTALQDTFVCVLVYLIALTAVSICADVSICERVYLILESVHIMTPTVAKTLDLLVFSIPVFAVYMSRLWGGGAWMKRCDQILFKFPPRLCAVRDQILFKFSQDFAR